MAGDAAGILLQGATGTGLVVGSWRVAVNGHHQAKKWDRAAVGQSSGLPMTKCATSASAPILNALPRSLLCPVVVHQSTLEEGNVFEAVEAIFGSPALQLLHIGMGAIFATPAALCLNRKKGRRRVKSPPPPVPSSDTPPEVCQKISSEENFYKEKDFWAIFGTQILDLRPRPPQHTYHEYTMEQLKRYQNGCVCFAQCPAIFGARLRHDKGVLLGAHMPFTVLCISGAGASVLHCKVRPRGCG